MSAAEAMRQSFSTVSHPLLARDAHTVMTSAFGVMLQVCIHTQCSGLFVPGKIFSKFPTWSCGENLTLKFLHELNYYNNNYTQYMCIRVHLGGKIIYNYKYIWRIVTVIH